VGVHRQQHRRVSIEEWAPTHCSPVTCTTRCFTRHQSEDCAVPADLRQRDPRSFASAVAGDRRLRSTARRKPHSRVRDLRRRERTDHVLIMLPTIISPPRQRSARPAFRRVWRIGSSRRMTRFRCRCSRDGIDGFRRRAIHFGGMGNISVLRRRASICR
jgi:hypothetical protein